MAAAELYTPRRRHETTPARPETAELLAAAHALAAQNLTPSYGPGDHGNLSCRLAEGCLISARHTRKATLRPDDLVHAIRAEETAGGSRQVLFDGPGVPSTDALLHLRLYARDPALGAVLHGHDPALLARAEPLGLPITRGSAAVNSRDVFEELVALAAQGPMVLMRDHGFLALAESVASALALIRRWGAAARAS